MIVAPYVILDNVWQEGVKPDTQLALRSDTKNQLGAKSAQLKFLD